MDLSNGMATAGQIDNDHQDISGGFGGLDLGVSSQPPLPRQQFGGQQVGKKTNEDLLGLF